MQIPPIRTSRWFIYVSTGLLLFLCLAVLTAGLILLSQASQPRVGQVAGSSMEPTLQGPRLLVTCGACQTVIPFAIDAWNPKRPITCPCCGRFIIAEDEPPIQRGENVRYQSAQWLRRIPNQQGSERIRRGDIVVLERESGSLKELKRVVGLPNEQVTLRDGDLWINEQRYEKTLRETLSQSVLLAAWDPRYCEISVQEFLESLSLPPTNELSINAHDSHALIPTYDVGIAVRFSQPIEKGRFVISLSDADSLYDIEASFNEQWTVACNDFPVPPISTREERVGKLSQWIIFALIDGRILVGDEFGTCFARALESVRSRAGDDLPTRSMMISSWEGVPPVDLVLVFRDLVYRGYGDAPEETIAAGPGYVVLGDNVSISDDSRGPAGGSVRWNADRIKGVIMQDPNDLASLLRQSEVLRSCDCRSHRLE